MKFIDSTNIIVEAGSGGSGCISFQKRGKGNFFGKPNGSNGGDGGDVWLLADSNMNTLGYFNDNRVFRAGNGGKGRSRFCTGSRGKDIIIKVPQGTRVSCQKTNQLLGDMVIGNFGISRLLVAKGGRHGIGNKNFRFLNQRLRSGVKRFVEHRIQGMPGEIQHLLLELFLIADVGLFGLPNSGKSSFIRTVSKAKPKVADYPFTTLEPYLGVVQVDPILNNSFIVADIPGIIKGASRGLGLGMQFLKHLKFCKMLLHFVDLNVLDYFNLINDILDIEKELNNYDAKLITKKRWLVFNKIDLLDKFESKKRIDYIIRALKWKEPYYFISVINNINITLLCNDIMRFIHCNSVLKE